MWREYLASVDASSVYVPNIVTSNLTYELAGLQAQLAANLSIDLIELGNEIYDHTVPEILQVHGASQQE